MKNKETNKSDTLEIYIRNVVIFKKRQAESAKNALGRNTLILYTKL